jgi:hypothetical protein
MTGRGPAPSGAACAARALIVMSLLGALSACDSAGFKRAYMALDSEGNRRRDVFYTDTSAIFCVVEMASGRADVTVTGRLRVLGWYLPPAGEAVETAGVLASEEQAPGVGEDLRVSFEWELEGNEPYPPGSFECELLLDGELEATLPFKVRYPDCPVAPLFSGLVCQGFVLPGARCPAAIAPGICTCQSDGVWAC